MQSACESINKYNDKYKILGNVGGEYFQEVLWPCAVRVHSRRDTGSREALEQIAEVIGEVGLILESALSLMSRLTAIRSQLALQIEKPQAALSAASRASEQLGPCAEIRPFVRDAKRRGDSRARCFA